MANWKLVAQNILSGCVGGLLAVSMQAQAQKTSPPTQYETRTQKLVLVDENNKQCGVLTGVSGNPLLCFNAGNSFVNLSASKLAGASMTLGRKNGKGVIIDVNDGEASVSAMHDSGHRLNLAATEAGATLTLAKRAKDSDLKRMLLARVDDDESSLAAFGTKSAIAVGDDSARAKVSMYWGITEPNAGSLAVRDGNGRMVWSQPPLFGSNRQ